MSDAKDSLKISSVTKLGTLKTTLSRGDVYRMKLTEKQGVKPKDEGDTGRNKYFVVLGYDGDSVIGIVLINSEINENLNPDIKNLQLKIAANKYGFLNYDSFVDCYMIKHFDKSDFENIFDLSKKKGAMETDDLSAIINKVKSSPATSKNEIKRFGL